MTREDASRLMIGDYVEYKTEQNGDNAWWNVAQVEGLSKFTVGGPCCVLLNKEVNTFWVKTERIRPINTTPELLAKNGFVSEKVGLNKTHWTKECITIEQFPNQFLMPCGLNEDIDVSEFHKLQQAIRLINDKELVL